MIKDQDYQANEKGYGGILNFAILNKSFESVKTILENMGDDFDF